MLLFKAERTAHFTFQITCKGHVRITPHLLKMNEQRITLKKAF